RAGLEPRADQGRLRGRGVGLLRAAERGGWLTDRGARVERLAADRGDRAARDGAGQVRGRSKWGSKQAAAVAASAVRGRGRRRAVAQGPARARAAARRVLQL